MDTTSIELPGTGITALSEEPGRVVVRFERAILIKTMTGSVEKTRWWQAGQLVFDEAEIEERPELPAVCTGGDVGENVYTYRDMLPLPLESRGHAHCLLRFEGTDRCLRIQARGVRLEMDGVPKYIEHIRPE